MYTKGSSLLLLCGTSTHVLKNQFDIVGRVALGDHIRRRVRDPHQPKLAANSSADRVAGSHPGHLLGIIPNPERDRKRRVLVHLDRLLANLCGWHILYGLAMPSAHTRYLRHYFVFIPIHSSGMHGHGLWLPELIPLCRQTPRHCPWMPHKVGTRGRTLDSHRTLYVVLMSSIRTLSS